jgi:hypothetical protein
LQGVHLKQIATNTQTALSGLSSGIYILSANGFQPEKILIY